MKVAELIKERILIQKNSIPFGRETSSLDFPTMSMGSISPNFNKLYDARESKIPEKKCKENKKNR